MVDICFIFNQTINVYRQTAEFDVKTFTNCASPNLLTITLYKRYSWQPHTFSWEQISRKRYIMSTMPCNHVCDVYHSRLMFTPQRIDARPDFPVTWDIIQQRRMHLLNKYRRQSTTQTRLHREDCRNDSFSTISALISVHLVHCIVFTLGQAYVDRRVSLRLSLYTLPCITMFPTIYKLNYNTG